MTVPSRLDRAEWALSTPRILLALGIGWAGLALD
jgi:hypothetical protein